MENKNNKQWNPIEGEGRIILIFNKFHNSNPSEIEIIKFINQSDLTKFVNEHAEKYEKFQIYGCYETQKEIVLEPAKIITKYFIRP